MGTSTKEEGKRKIEHIQSIIKEQQRAIEHYQNQNRGITDKRTKEMNKHQIDNARKEIKRMREQIANIRENMKNMK